MLKIARLFCQHMCTWLDNQTIDAKNCANQMVWSEKPEKPISKKNSNQESVIELTRVDVGAKKYNQLYEFI